MNDIAKRAQKLLENCRFSPDKAKNLEDFIREELSTGLSEVSIKIRDLMEIYSQAANIAANLPKETEINGTNVYSDPKLLQAYCYTLALVSKMRAKGALIHAVEFGTQKDKMKRESR